MYVAQSDLQLQYMVLPVAKRLIIVFQRSKHSGNHSFDSNVASYQYEKLAKTGGIM